MKLLIDTQILIWLVNDDKALGPKSRQLLSDTVNQVSVSYFSLFEIAIKSSVGKITFDPSVVDDLPKMGIDLLSASFQHLIKYQVFDQSNKDPFDNILLAVAKAEKYTFITSDEKILAAHLPDIKRLDATA